MGQRFLLSVPAFHTAVDPENNLLRRPHQH